jgi:hypothetical protein
MIASQVAMELERKLAEIHAQFATLIDPCQCARGREDATSVPRRN